jgi:lipopolysaccharide export system permease protein
MKTLRSYFLREFLGPLALSVGVISFVMVVVGNLKKVADFVINKGVDPFSVLQLFMLMTPYIVTYALPISVLIAVLLALGRLSSDNEVVAVRSCGINIAAVLTPYLFTGFILSLALVIFNDRAASYAHFQYRKTLIDIGVRNPTAAFEEGVFINSFEKYIIFIYRVDQSTNSLSNIRIYEPQGDDKPTRTIVARSGEFITDPVKKTVKLKLIDGTSDEPDPDNPRNFYKLNFKNYFMNLNLVEGSDGKPIEKKPKDMSFEELRAEIQKLRSEGINPAPLITELNEKLALAFSCFVFILIGTALGIMTRRREKSINIGIALMVILVYYPLFVGCKALGIQGHVDPYLAMWIPNLLIGAAGSALFARVCVY